MEDDQDRAGRAFAEGMEAFREQSEASPTPEGLLDSIVSAATFTFRERINELREALPIEHRGQARPARLVELGASLSTKQRRDAEAVVDRFRDDFAREIQAQFTDVDLPTGATYPVPTELVLGAIPLVMSSAVRDVAVQVFEDLASIDIRCVDYGRAFLAWDKHGRRPNAAVSALVPAAVSEYEALLGALLRCGLLRHPKALGVDEKQFTIAEYASTGGVQILVQLMAIDKIVGAYLREGLLTWNTKLVSWPGVSLERLTASWSLFVEVFLRRNVIIHNRGEADADYLRLLPADLPSVARGSLLVTDRSYVSKAIDMIELAGLALSAVWLPSILSHQVVDPNRAVEAVYMAISSEQWATAILLADQFLPAIAVAESDGRDARAIIQINRWMAIRERDGSTDAIIADVENWEPPDDDHSWRLARALLLGDVRTAKSVLGELRGAGSRLSEIQRWPLFRAMEREHPEIRVAIARTVAPKAGGGRRRRR